MFNLLKRKKALEKKILELEFILKQQKLDFDFKQKELEIEFERKVKHWEEDKHTLTERLRKEHESKITERETLLNLSSQQDIAQLELNHKKELLKIEKNFNDILTKKEREFSEKFFKDLTTAFTEMQLNGDKNSKYVQELSLKMIDKIPNNTSKKTNKLT